jgi:disulfide bond formation protein DsbB
MTQSGSRTYFAAASLIVLGMAVVILSALGLQYIGDYIPCELCLKERIPYYSGIPVAMLAALAAAAKAPANVTRSLLGLAGVIMLAGTGLSIYHAGVEWAFWAGPASCTSSINSITNNAGNLLNDLSTQHAPSCSVAALRILGISLSGWNVLATLLFAAVAFFGATRKA